MKTDGNDMVFPPTDKDYQNNSLSKREYFAVIAMQGLLANNYDIPLETIVLKSKQAADELIKELNIS